jgi:hypothetical protein
MQDREVVVLQLDIPIAWNPKLRFALPSATILVHCRRLECWSVDSADPQHLSIGDATVPLPAWMMPVLGNLERDSRLKIDFIGISSIGYKYFVRAQNQSLFSVVNNHKKGPWRRGPSSEVPRIFVQSYSRKHRRTCAWPEPRILGSVIVGVL